MSASRPIALTILAVSLAMSAGALLFEYAGGLAPCELCLAERWPYYAAIALAILALAAGRHAVPWWIGLAVLIFAASTVLAAYHVGVEQHWIAGPTACSGFTIGPGTTAEDLRKMLEAREAVRCDEIQWALFGVSLAGWNLIVSLLLLVFSGSGLRLMLREARA